jgi:sugar phosphate isomerase/epimerase
MTAPHNPARTFLTCFSTMGCTELTLPQVLSLADQFSIDCLELRSLENRIDLTTYLAEQPGGLPTVRQSLARHPARVLGTSFKLVGDTEAGRTTLISFAQLAEQIGTPYLRIFGGGTWGTALTDENYRQAVELLNWWQEQKKKNSWQVEILIETHDAFSATPPLLKLFELLGRTHPIIWDSHHTWRLAGETPADSWKHLKPHTRHVHIKDSILQPSARHPYTYVLPGTGEMPARQVLDLLQKDHFNGAVSLEWEKMWHPYLTPIQDALAACQKEKWW